MGGIPWQLALIWIGHKLRGGPSALHAHLWEKRELVTRLSGGDPSIDMCTAKSAAKDLRRAGGGNADMSSQMIVCQKLSKPCGSRPLTPILAGPYEFGQEINPATKNYPNRVSTWYVGV
jgi:hypothetical protein